MFVLENERVAMQRQAEEEAEARLVQATGTFASAMKRLAAGDMLCEVNEPLAAQFEGLRHDFNTSVRQLREALVSVGGSVDTVTGGSREISDARRPFQAYGTTGCFSRGDGCCARRDHGECDGDIQTHE